MMKVLQRGRSIEAAKGVLCRSLLQRGNKKLNRSRVVWQRCVRMGESLGRLLMLILLLMLRLKRLLRKVAAEVRPICMGRKRVELVWHRVRSSRNKMGVLRV